MNKKAVVAISSGTFLAGFGLGSMAMNKAMDYLLQANKPLISKMLADTIDKALIENMQGANLEAYIKEQMDFFKIAKHPK